MNRYTWQYCRFIAYDIREARECLQACIQWQIDEDFWDQEATWAVRVWELEHGFGTDDDFDSD